MTKRDFILSKADIKLSLLAITFLLTFIPIFTYVYFARDLTSKERVMNRNDTGIMLVDRENKPFFTFYSAKNKVFVPLSNIPQSTQKAVIAVEDKEFYSHPGFSIKGIARSIIVNTQNRDVVSGGSTLTQQLVKNSLLTPSRDLMRKYQEIVLAEELERRFSKDEILEMYLNSVYFGQGSFGIGEAAQTYFGKNASELTLAESALLAGILPAPSKYSSDDETVRERRSLVLTKMLEQGYINADQKTQAEKTKINLQEKDSDLNSHAQHFAFMVRDELIQKYGEEKMARSGFKVRTSLNLDWQEYAEGVVANQVKKLAPNRVSNGAAVVMDPKTGEILTLVGSANWDNDNFGKVNVATSLRQPGSAFKPIVYAAGFEKRIITPGTVLKDEPVTYNIAGSPPYRPQNYDKKFRGPVLPRRALSNSLNVPSVEVLSRVGLPTALDTAKRLGITTLEDPNRYGLSLVLGGGEIKLIDITNAYATFASNGLKNDPTTILEIDDKSGRDVYTFKPEPHRVIEEEVTFLISSILSDVSARAEVFGTALNISRPAAVKTGTTENYRDSLTLGYTPSLTIGVWVGNNDSTPMDNIAGSLGAAPIWKQLMEKFLSGTPVEKFTPPSNVTGLFVCRNNGLLLKEATTAGTLEYFIKGTEPKGTCNLPKPPEVKPGEEKSPVDSSSKEGDKPKVEGVTIDVIKEEKQQKKD
jgi:1A family penicillin-binding protein